MKDFPSHDGPPQAGGAAPLGHGAYAARTAPRAETIAALDLGTNNCRLLVARTSGHGFRVIDAFSRITRLGEGLATTGALSEAAMRRTIDALAVCAAKIAHRGARRGRFVATEACRRAVNCSAFLDRVQRATGLDVEIIPTDEEARLAVTGCAPLLDPQVPWAIVFDIGGGSTEIVWSRLGRDGPDIVDLVSLPSGVVNLTERYGGDLVSAETYAEMREEVRAAILPFESRHRIAERVARGEVQMLGSSGTVTTLAGIQLGLPRYIRALVDGSFLDFSSIDVVCRRLAALDLAARAQHPCVGVERADLVVAGCAILEAICALWPVGRLRVADRGIREGILIGLTADVAAGR